MSWPVRTMATAAKSWIDHHGRHGKQSTRGIVAPGAREHPILRGIRDGDIWGPTDVYEVRLPLPFVITAGSGTGTAVVPLPAASAAARTGSSTAALATTSDMRAVS